MSLAHWAGVIGLLLGYIIALYLPDHFLTGLGIALLLDSLNENDHPLA